MTNLVELTNIKLTEDDFNFIKSKLKSCTCNLVNERRTICIWCEQTRKRFGIDPYASAKAWHEYRVSNLSIL